MKKLQLIAVLFLALLFAFSCASDEEDEETANNDQTDTVSGGDTGTPADTLPDDQGDTGSADTPDDPADSGTQGDDSDKSDPGNDSEKPVPDDDVEPVSDSDALPDSDHVGPETDGDAEPMADDDAELMSDSDVEPMTGDDAEPAPDSDSNDDDIQSDPDIQADDDPFSDNNPADDDAGSDNDAESPNDNDSEPADSLPECSPASGAPCRDSLRGNIWSSRSTEKFTLKNDKAQQHCEDLEEGGYPKGSWKLPTIDELRTLILDCPKAEYEGECQVSDPDCLSAGTDCYDPEKCNNQNICTASYEGSHSKLGDNQNLWSSSKCSGSSYTNYAFVGMFLYGTVGRDTMATPYYVRCIKK